MRMIEGGACTHAVGGDVACECPVCRKRVYAIFDEAYDTNPEIRDICFELGLGPKRPTKAPADE